jgi:uncharacterized membrane protein
LILQPLDSSLTVQPMTVSIARNPWNPSPAAARPAVWRFGVELADSVPGRRGWQWHLRRNSSLAPRQLVGGYLMLSLASLAVATTLWWQGAPYVLGFTAVELLALGAALLIYARHAADNETISLSGGDMAVSHQFGRAVERQHFRAEWVRVEPAAAEGSLVELSGEGRQTHVGRYLRPELRSVLASEIRRALKLSREASPRNLEEPLK